MSEQPGKIFPEQEHLNCTGCVIKSTPDKGRGVYASRLTHRNTLVDISPVLFFSKEEYEAHGRHTVLDHYAFVWPDGRMALALGLGSLFNHSDPPNVSYTLDTATDSIKYTTTRDVDAGEELCIFYGHKLWFIPAGEGAEVAPSTEHDNEDAWGELSGINDEQIDDIKNPFVDGDQTELIAEGDLPFTRFKLPPEEEDAQSIRTVQAWIVDVPEPRHITTLLKWLKQVGLDGPELGHLKRIRKQGDSTSLLLCTTLDPPQLPQDLTLPAPYLLPVPESSALTMPSLILKSALWPTMYTPRRKDEPEPWSRGKLKWAWDAMKVAFDAASKAKEDDDELPIAAHIPAPFNDSGDEASPGSTFTASDTRSSTRHPLRHAAINAIRKLADYRASSGSDTQMASGEDIIDLSADKDERQNGSNYLLTDRIFFITHEPCIMCSMALLHSRVKEVAYLYPMSETGGCGGSACLPTLKGVNHRFGILQWNMDSKFGRFGEQPIETDSTIDA